MDRAVRDANLLGAAVASMGLFGGILAGGSPAPGVAPLSQAASHAMGGWCQSIQAAATFFQGAGVPTTAAEAAAAALGVLVPVATCMAVSQTGRMAIEIGKKGVKQFWADVTGRTRDAELRRDIEARVGPVAAVMQGKDGDRGGLYYIRTEDGQLYEVEKAQHDAFRRDILRDKGAAVVLKGDDVLAYDGGRLASSMRVLPGASHGNYQVVARDAATREQTTAPILDYIAGKPRIEPTLGR